MAKTEPLFPLAQIPAEPARRLNLLARSAAEAPTNGLSDHNTPGVEPTVRGLPVPANAAGASYMSPRMKARSLNFVGGTARCAVSGPSPAPFAPWQPAQFSR